MFYQLLLVALVFLMAISTLNNVNDAEGETARTARRVLSVIAVAVLVAFLVFHRLALREGMIGTTVVGFVALAAIGAYHLRAQGRRTVHTVGVYLGSNAVEGRSAKDSAGRELPLYEPVFEYEYRGEMYCTPARDLYFSRTLYRLFHRGRRYRLWLDASNPWDYQCGPRSRYAWECFVLAAVFLAIAAMMFGTVRMQPAMAPDSLQTASAVAALLG
ncbi:MAG: hypothetical protein Q4G29_02045 [Pseudoscardovia radai]|nr:hypothetical protein [Pseudoscardovia radai]